MPLTIKLLATGRLQAADTALYTVPAATRTIVKTITLVNIDIVTRVVNLKLEPAGGLGRHIMPFNMNLATKYLVIIDEPFTLGPGDRIRGWSDVADEVDYTISGVEET